MKIVLGTGNPHKVYEVNEIGYAKLEKINYSSKPYIHLYSINNNDFNKNSDCVMQSEFFVEKRYGVFT